MKIFLALLTLALLAATVFFAYQDRAFVRKGQVVTATVVGVGQHTVRRNSNTGPRYRTVYKAQYVFELNGEEYEWSPPYNTTWQPEFGAEQELVVNPRNPEDAKLNSFFFLYLVPTILFGISTFFLILTLLSWIGGRILKKRRPTWTPSH